VAAEMGYTECVDLLLQQGASTTARDKNKFAPIHRAASAGQVHSTLTCRTSRSRRYNELHSVQQGAAARGTLRASIFKSAFPSYGRISAPRPSSPHAPRSFL
jgi:ankyrin repeat protein